MKYAIKYIEATGKKLYVPAITGSHTPHFVGLEEAALFDSVSAAAQSLSCYMFNRGRGTSVPVFNSYYIIEIIVPVSRQEGATL